jgi:hypothetical protein
MSEAGKTEIVEASAAISPALELPMGMKEAAE